MTKLFRIPGAAAFLGAVFLNAFVDLGHKIVIQNTVFKAYDGQTQIVLTAIVNALILLPFVALLSPAGFVGDRYPKNEVMRATAWSAVVLTSAITVFYYLGWFWPAFAMTFLLAAQSAFYSPAKYGYIKPLFGKERLGEANGVVQATTIVAILAGTFAFSALFESLYGTGETGTGAALRAVAPLGWLLVGNSLLELLLVYRLPALETGDPAQSFDWRSYRNAKLLTANLARLKHRPVINLSILGLATFWSIGQVMLAAFPTYAETRFAITNTAVIQATLACSGVGIALGSALAARGSRHHIETGLIPLGAIGVALGLWVLPSAGSPLTQGLWFFAIGLMGALFIVPLNALIQFNAGKHELGRILAANNWFQNLAMTAFLLLTVALALGGLDSRFLLGLIAAVATIGGCYTVYKLPQSLVRYALATLIAQHYRVRVQGLGNIPETGGVLLLGNHVSWVDWAVVQIACPRRVRFVMRGDIYEKWYLSWLLRMMRCIPIEPGASSRAALGRVSEALNGGHVVCLFPEGTITRTGHLAEFRHGYEWACKDAAGGVVIVPFYLRGLWGSQFSRSSKGLMRRRASGLKRDLIVAFGQSLEKDTPADIVKRRVFDLSMVAWETYADDLPTVPHAWIESAKRVGGRLAMADPLSGELSGLNALTAAICFARRVRRGSRAAHVGLLLPTSAGGMLANMAVLLAGRAVVNLNYTASDEALRSAIEQADLESVYTSRRFVERLAKRGRELLPLLEKTRVMYLEDLRADIGRGERVATALLARALPAGLLRRVVCDASDPRATAAILFSSGSEGAPKGVMLSHRNLMVNVNQVADALNMQDDDLILASLPLFHAFGLTVTQLMPLIMGIPLACQADPTDALGIARTTARYHATILCSTSSFLRLLARNPKVHPLMLRSLRIIVAGAEPLNPDVRTAFQSQFGAPVFEGYGCTETAPVASSNLPDALDTQSWKVQVGNRPGTVGMPLPGTSFKIVDPDTWAELPTGEQGMILIGGPQVMQGYLGAPEKTADAVRTLERVRWYVTGDKGSVDEDGFLSISDRYSRFAKIAGEMISLSAVERAVRARIGDSERDLVAVNVPSEKKGESISLLHEGPLDGETTGKAMLDAGCNPLMIPSQWLAVDAVPKLGSGKTDFGAAKVLAARALPGGG